MARAYGLSAEAALRAITLSPAEILGVADRLGSIAPGKDADLFVARGDIMDPRTGYPAQGVVSVSVIAPRTIDSEAWTKPYYVNGRQWASRHLQKDFRVFLCEDKKEAPCAWLQ